MLLEKRGVVLLAPSLLEECGVLQVKVLQVLEVEVQKPRDFLKRRVLVVPVEER